MSMIFTQISFELYERSNLLLEKHIKNIINLVTYTSNQ